MSGGTFGILIEDRRTKDAAAFLAKYPGFVAASKNNFPAWQFRSLTEKPVRTPLSFLARV